MHPLRWPGSWHLKATPKLARIVALNDAAEVDLQDAVEALEDAAQADGLRDVGLSAPASSGQQQAPLALVESALAALPNDDEHWDQWIKIGLLTYAATGASEDGLNAWIEWSLKSSKFVSGACEERWQHFTTSPPTRGGAGTLFMLAKAAGWVRPWKDEPELGHHPRSAPKANDQDSVPPQFTDEALALRFSREHKDRLRYVAVWGRWLICDGNGVAI